MKNNLDWKIEESKKVIKVAVDKWQPNIGIAFTGRKDSSVMVHLIRQLFNNVPKCMFIDHGYHFEETVQTVKLFEKEWDLNIEYIKDQVVFETTKKEKSKIKKLENITKYKINAIKSTIKNNGWKAVFTAVRWDEHPARMGEGYFSKRKDHIRVHPILHFTEGDIWEYIRRNNIPYNNLYDLGYRSIGEKNITKNINLVDDKGEREGRSKQKEAIMDRLRAMGYF